MHHIVEHYLSRRAETLRARVLDRPLWRPHACAWFPE
jgi:hypothetical protein